VSDVSVRAARLPALGALIAVAGAFVPPSYDEGEWIAVARRVAGGAHLYRDVIDNKGPIVYRVVHLLDRLPGSFPVARGIFLAVVACVIGASIAGVARHLGMRADRANWLGVGSCIAVALQSVLVLNIETGAVLAIAPGLYLIASGRPRLGSALAALSVAVDPRALALMLGVIVFVGARHGMRKAMECAAVAALIVGAWVVFVLAQPALRYALLELNVATRRAPASWRPGAILFSIVAAVLPLIATFLAATGRALPRLRWRSAGTILLATAAAIAFASRFPFYKYWILAIPALPILAAQVPDEDDRRRPAFAALAMIMLATVPLVMRTVSIHAADARLLRAYERASAVIDATLRPGERFVQFDTQPYMSMLQPERASLSWVVYDFVQAGTSRTPADLVALETAVRSAAVLQDDGALGAPREAVTPGLRPAWDIFAAHLDSFPCIRRYGPVTLRFTPQRCP
jgi:hypothetical protein